MSRAPHSSEHLDLADPLASYRDRFVGAETSLVYFDGNSLGRPLRAAADALTDFTAHAWGTRLIRGWDDAWMELPLTLGDRVGAAVLGAAAGQVAVADSTSVWLYKVLRAACALQQAKGRMEIVLDSDNFPTDRYVAEGVAKERGLLLRWIDVDPRRGVTPEQLQRVVGPKTAIVVLSHVAYRSAWLADAPTLTQIAHDAGAVIVWDVCHSAGSVPIELDAWGADFAVGCTYKYLNGGPGSPGYAYVAKRHQDSTTQPIQGWMGHADPFTMGPGYRPADGMRRFLSGTPPILAMVPLQAMLSLIEEVGMNAVREKSIALTSYAARLAEDRLSAFGVSLASPSDPQQRGGHITLQHPRMRELTQALWQRDVIPDYRDPGGLRIGLSPLSTSFGEVDRGMETVARLFAEE